MNKKLRGGRASELMVAGELLRRGVDVYLPCVDDQAIDLVARVEQQDTVKFYDLQVKSVAGYNRLLGVHPPPQGRESNCILVIHYRHANRPDEFFYLRGDQIAQHVIAGSSWGDLVFNKREREKYGGQSLDHLARFLSGAGEGA